jgi:hypothetical protein
MLEQLYGPVSAIIYTPSALASHPSSAAIIGAFINLTSFLLPTTWFLWVVGRRSGLATSLAAVVALVLIACRQFVLSEGATRVTIDMPATGFAICALTILAMPFSRRVSPVAALGASEDPPPVAAASPLPNPWMTGALCGAFGALALWCKYTLGPVLIAMPLFVVVCAGWHAALRFTTAMLLVVSAISATLILWLGPEMLFQTLVIPSRQPIQWPGMDRTTAYLRAARWMWIDARPIGTLAIGGMLLGIVASLPWRRQVRDWLAEQLWLLPLLCALLVMPTTIVARAKLGAAFNHVVPGATLFLLAGTAAVLMAARDLRAAGRLARIALVIMIGMHGWLGSAVREGVLTQLGLWQKLNQTEHEAAYQLAKKYPGELYFPLHPVSSLLAEGKAYHFAVWMDDFAWAGYPIDDMHLRSGLPQNMRAILYRENTLPPSVLDRLPEYQHRSTSAVFPGWIIVSREPAPVI